MGNRDWRGFGRVNPGAEMEARAMSFRYDQDEYVASTWTLEHRPLKDALDAFHCYGFSQVEIWADTVHLDPRVKPDIPQVKAWLRQYGMAVHSLHAPFRNYHDRPADEMEFCRARTRLLKQTCDYAQALGCPILVVHAVDRKEYNYPMAQLGVVTDYIGETVRYAAQRGVRVAIEDIPPGGDPSEIYTTLENQKRLFADLDIDFCLDIGHVPLLGADVYREVDAAGGRLITLHIHNNCGKSDDHNLPGDGVLNWPVLHDYIRKSGYQGQFVLEIYGGEGPEAETKALEGIGRLFDR